MLRFTLQQQQQQCFEEVLKIGILKDLYESGLLSSRQLQVAIQKARIQENRTTLNDAV